MDLTGSQFFSALLSIIMIDIVLGGDNAILIALATRKLTKTQRKKAIFWGVLGAIIVRAGLTVVFVYVLNIPFVELVGGILLVWIGYKLLVDEDDHEEIKSGESLRDAIRTIIVADLLMGIDNVLAVAGAANKHPLLVVLGLLISVPIIVWGSTLILRFIERFPIIIYIGAGVISWTAGKMIAHDRYIIELLNNYSHLELFISTIIVIGVLLAGYLKRRQLQR